MNWRKVIEDRRGMLIDKENAYTELICSYRRRLATYQKAVEQLCVDSEKKDALISELERKTCINEEQRCSEVKRLRRRVEELQQQNCSITSKCEVLQLSLDKAWQESARTLPTSTLLVEIEIDGERATPSIYTAAGLQQYRELSVRACEQNMPKHGVSETSKREHTVELLFE